MRLVPLFGAVLVAGSIASAAGADRTVTSPGRVLGLARSAYSVAFLSGPSKGHCGPHVELWDLATRGVHRLGRRTDAFCLEETSTGSGVTVFSVARTRALWLAYTGGNTREWLLYTATTTRPAERMLEFRAVDVDDPPPIVVGVASEFVLPYSVGSTVKALADNGKLLYRWQAPGRVTNMTTYGRQVAVFVEGGRCFVLSRTGVVERAYTFPRGAVQEFALFDTRLVVQLPGGRIEIHRDSSVRRLTIPAKARMLDFAGLVLLYKLGNDIRARQVMTGKDVPLRRATFAQLERTGLSYAVGKRVYSVAMAYVLAALKR